MNRVKITAPLLSMSIFLMLNNCVSTVPCNGTVPGTEIITKDGNDHTISDVCISTLNNDSARIFCRVQKYGKRVNGYLDFAVVTPDGIVVFQGSVKSKMSSRGGVHTRNAIGFPFEFNLSQKVLRGNTLRLTFHEKEKTIIFQSGEKNLAL